MTEFLKGLASIKFHLLVFCAGLTSLYLSVFSALPSPTNDWQFLLRPAAHTGLLTCGIILVAFSLSIYILVSSLGLEDNLPLFFARSIVREFDSLSDTQKEILRTLHETHRSEVSLSFFYEFLEQKIPGRSGTQDELYFRLKDLASKRLIGLKTVAKKATTLSPLSRIGKALNFPSG